MRIVTAPKQIVAAYPESTNLKVESSPCQTLLIVSGDKPEAFRDRWVKELQSDNKTWKYRNLGE